MISAGRKMINVLEKGLIMTEILHHDPQPEEMASPNDGGSFPGVVAELGELKPGSIISEEGMARLFHRHAVSVKRAVQLGEFPPPPLFRLNLRATLPTQNPYHTTHLCSPLVGLLNTRLTNPNAQMTYFCARRVSYVCQSIQRTLRLWSRLGNIFQRP